MGDGDSSSDGNSTPRGRPSPPNGSRKQRGHATTKRRDSVNSSPIGSSSPSLSSTGLTSSVISQAVPPSLPHIHLSTSHPKPEALKELINHLTSPPLTSMPSEDTCTLVKQWRLSQYRDVREREHHYGSLLGWPSEYAMGATSEFHMDKALNAEFVPQDPKLDWLLSLHPVRPTFTYGFTSTAFTAPQQALTMGMLDSAKVMPAGEDPQFPFLAQKWINDSDSRREAEREMARAGAAMCRALRTFYREVCKWEEVEVDDTLTFTMVVSPEVCRLFVNWIEKFHSEDRPQFYKDLVYAAFMEDAMQVQKMRTICDRIKDWMRDLRLMNLKDALDIMIDANETNAANAKEEEKKCQMLEEKKRQMLDELDRMEEQLARKLEQRRTNGSTTKGSTTNGSITNGLTTNEPTTNELTTKGSTTNWSITNGLTTNEPTTNAPITDRPSTNGSKPSEKVNARPAELTEEQKTNEELSMKLAIQLEREEEERAEREKRQSIKAGKAGVNPDEGNALLHADRRRVDTRFNWERIVQESPKKKMKMSLPSPGTHDQKTSSFEEDTAPSEQETSNFKPKTHSLEQGGCEMDIEKHQDCPLSRVSPKSESISSDSRMLSQGAPGSETKVNQGKAAESPIPSTSQPERPALEKRRANSTETVIWRGDDAEEQTDSKDPEPNVKDSVPAKKEPSP